MPFVLGVAFWLQLLCSSVAPAFFHSLLQQRMELEWFQELL